MIEFEIKPTEHDAVRSYWVHNRPRVALRVLGGLLLLVLSWAMVATALQIIRSGTWVEAAAIWLVVPALAFSLYWQTRRIRINHRELNDGAPSLIRVGDSGIEVASDAAIVSFEWNRIGHWRESKRLWLIYYSSDLYFVIPRDQLTDVTALAVRDVLTSEVGPPS